MADDIDPVDQLDALLAEQEKSIRDAFRAFLAAMASDAIGIEVVRLIENRDIEGAMKIVDSYIAQMANVLPRVSVSVGETIMSNLAGIIPDSVIGVGFDPTLPRAAELIAEHRAEFVVDFTDQQRRATSQAIARSYREGTGTQGTARAFRQSIGLTTQEEQAVASYRASLRNLDREALSRALRDPRSDGVLSRAIEANKPLSDKQVESMVSRYRANALTNRSERIARTEGVRATSEATIEANTQMAEQTGIDLDRIIYTWNVTKDTRTRHWHASMSGQKRDDSGNFRDGLGNLLRYPGDPKAPARTIINCRCVLTTSIAPAA